MSPGTLPLLIVALLMMLGDGTEVDRTEIIFAGTHPIDADSDGLVVAGGVATLSGSEVDELYVVAGEVSVRAGSSIQRITQLGGTVTLEEGATIGHLRSYGGEISVDEGAAVSSRVTLETATRDGPRGSGPLPAVAGTLALGSLGGWLAGRRPDQLDNLSAAATEHPVVSLAVGITLVLTGIALIVFMAFTLILIPISILGVLLGSMVLALGIIGWGHAVGRTIRGAGPRLSTASGIAAVVATMWLVGRVPLLGDTVVMVALVTGFGAAVVSLLGFRRFTPPSLPRRVERS